MDRKNLIYEELAVAGRFTAIHQSGQMDSPKEPEFDSLTRLAARLLRVPIAVISLVDEDRQFFKSQCGLPETLAAARETPLSHSFCQHVQVTAVPLIIADARLHQVVHNNLAIQDLGVIAYAGVPIFLGDGVLGAFCAIDMQPRDWTDDDLHILRSLADQASAEIELRLTAKALNSEVQVLMKSREDLLKQTRFTVHDLRTPLNALHLSIQAIPMSGEVSEEQEEYLRLATATISTLTTMVDDLQSAAIESLKSNDPVLFNDLYIPGDLLRRAVEQVNPLAIRGGITLEMDPPAEALPMLNCDGEKVLRVLINLLGNAIRFTPAGGWVRASLRKVDEMPSPSLHFIVEDTGCGIAEHDLQHIFHEGVSVERRVGHSVSTGLGLAFGKVVADRHGGRIWAESTVGVGSRFHLSLPIS